MAVKKESKRTSQNHTVVDPTPNFFAIGEQEGDYEVMTEFNQTLTNSIMNPLETELIRK